MAVAKILISLVNIADVAVKGSVEFNLSPSSGKLLLQIEVMLHIASWLTTVLGHDDMALTAPELTDNGDLGWINKISGDLRLIFIAWASGCCSVTKQADNNNNDRHQSSDQPPLCLHSKSIQENFPSQDVLGLLQLLIFDYDNTTYALEW